MVVPEVASPASVLRTCQEQKICLWMGETGGRNEHAWQTTMYEMVLDGCARFGQIVIRKSEK